MSSVLQIIIFILGWNRRLNGLCDHRALGMYRLIPVLHEEAELLPTQVRMVSEGKLSSHVRKAALKKNMKIFRAWLQYKSKDITPAQLLLECASVHGPVID